MNNRRCCHLPPARWTADDSRNQRHREPKDSSGGAKEAVLASSSWFSPESHRGGRGPRQAARPLCVVPCCVFPKLFPDRRLMGKRRQASARWGRRRRRRRRRCTATRARTRTRTRPQPQPHIQGEEDRRGAEAAALMKVKWAVRCLVP